VTSHGHLRAAADAELQGVRLRALHEAATTLSTRYREGAAAVRARPFTDLERLAYLAVRMPATYAAIGVVTAQAAHATDPGVVRTLLDLGSGAGAALWAAADAWPALERATLIDADADMLALGARVWARHPRAHAIAIDSHRVRLDGGFALPSADIVTISYLLGELDPAAARELVRRAVDAARTAVLIVEPGTPAGYRTVIEARTRSIDMGAHIVAPCPHEAPCPLTGADWCHFAVRLERSRVHRQLKEADLAWEDEKFSYLIATPGTTNDVRREGRAAEGRILRRPLIEKGRIALRVCGRDGLVDVAVTRRDPAWRAARHARWGGEWPVREDADMVETP
jgi:ribosomal protein RSM22 (predicted rRNA methylase)